uniref:RNA-dependent RNA polymerase n=1 Tax=Dubrovin virus TaxID=2707215 RepID=A0A6H0DIP1_9VIRU|nr:MAG: RNA-dependent RNA polymerase [Dubrovin virus]
METDIRDALPKLDTHAGFSSILTGKGKKGQYLDGNMVSTLNKTIERARKEKSFNRPILIGTRTQASLIRDDEGILNRNRFKSKTRLVSMIDIEQILVETKWAKPVQKQMACVDWYAGGKNDAQIMKHLFHCGNIFTDSVTIDYSHYDQSIPSWLIRESFDVVKACFAKVDEELFSIMVNDFIHKVFIDGKGNLRYASKGVPSGSMFTQIIDSIANRLMILSYLYSKQYKDYEFEMMIMGDDNIIFTNEALDMHELGDFLNRNFGITCHPEKCTQTHGHVAPEFLSRTWTREGVYRDPLVLLSKLVAPERYRSYEKSQFTGSFEEKVKYEIMLLIKAYFISFPKGMRELISNDGAYDRAYWSPTISEIARSKMTTGLIQYLAKIEDKYSV